MQGENIGIRYRMVRVSAHCCDDCVCYLCCCCCCQIIQEDLDDRCEMLLVYEVLPLSSASQAGIRPVRDTLCTYMYSTVA